MKFYDTNGREHSIAVRPSKWPRKEEGRGKFQSYVGEILSEVYSGYYVLEEFPCVGEGLFLDFYLPQKSLAIEVHGRQHYEFNDFFHRDKKAFARQKANDRRKREWCEVNNIVLVVIDVGENEEKIKSLLP